MTSSVVMENEELENIPLVRMEDVQPDRTVEYLPGSEEVFETCIIDGAYENCMEDENSNVGSMVSVKSEENSAISEDEEDNYNINEDIETKPDIKPKLLPPQEDIFVEKLSKEYEILKPNQSERWPTLEILPGGVINRVDSNDRSRNQFEEGNVPETGNNAMFACAKCSESFQYLSSLITHVRTHEGKKITSLDKKILNIKTKECKDNPLPEHIIKTGKGQIMSEVVVFDSAGLEKANLIKAKLALQRKLMKTKKRRVPKES